MTSTVRTAEKLASTLNTMSDDSAAAMLADRGQFVNRALEAVKNVPVPGRDDFETQRVVIPADLAFCHVCEIDPPTM